MGKWLKVLELNFRSTEWKYFLYSEWHTSLGVGDLIEERGIPYLHNIGWGNGEVVIWLPNLSDFKGVLVFPWKQGYTNNGHTYVDSPTGESFILSMGEYLPNPAEDPMYKVMKNKAIKNIGTHGSSLVVTWANKNGNPISRGFKFSIIK